MRADLHLHSVYSDGHYSPEEVCIRAKNNGVELISITDHDSMNGAEEKLAAAKRHGLSCIQGWEISSYVGIGKIHITGYGCERNDAYHNFLKERIISSRLRAEDSVKKLNSLGIGVTVEQVFANCSDETAPVHTMHICRAVEQETGMPAGDVYNRYIAPGMPASSLIGRPSPWKAVECIHDCGGIACIAHPGRIEMPFSEREQLIRDLKNFGVDGMEVYYPTHTDKETQYFLALSKELSLLVSGGSDTHYESSEKSIGDPYFEPSEDFLSRVKVFK